MKSQTRLYVKIEDGQAIGHVAVEISDSFDMHSVESLDQLCERYVRPAIEQALRELQYAKERKTA